MKNFFAAAIVIFLLASCDYDLSSVSVSQSDSYIIKEGSHSSTFSFKGFDGSALTFEAMFDESVIYKTKEPSNQADVNKLLGFSDCGVNHHENSARLGWRWYNDRLEILAYVYNNKKRIIEYLTSVPLGEFVNYEISKTRDGYVFRVGDITKPVSADFSNCSASGNYYLWPYFGGDETAPQQIEITIQEIKEHKAGN